jgi:hypothetical protein
MSTKVSAILKGDLNRGLLSTIPVAYQLAYSFHLSFYRRHSRLPSMYWIVHSTDISFADSGAWPVALESKLELGFIGHGPGEAVVNR